MMFDKMVVDKMVVDKIVVDKFIFPKNGSSCNSILQKVVDEMLHDKMV